MSSRVTRSSARLVAEAAAPESSLDTTQAPVSSKKRKASSRQELSSPDTEPGGRPPSASRRGKRQKVEARELATPGPATTDTPHKTRQAVRDTAMTNTGSSSKSTEDSFKAPPSSKLTSKRPSSKSKKVQDLSSSPPQTTPLRRQKKRNKKETTTEQKEVVSHTKKNENDSSPAVNNSDSVDDEDDESPKGMEGDNHDPFGSSLFGAGRVHGGLGNTLRALSGMMSGISSRLRDILNNLRQVDNPTMQMIALEELSNLLLVSNEDNLSGQFSPDPYIKELVTLMQPHPLTGEENPEMMLLACRCIANLMEALRGSVANVVYGGAVPVLCQKLLDIQYIDVAEQALSTLSKVSEDFPASIVREGGLTACLQFLDFFATGTQRTAVTTAANCCRNIPQDSFPVIRDVMPILQNVLASHDQKVVEQGCLCVTRVIDSFKRSPEKLEELVDVPLLRAVLGLLVPGTTNLIGPSIHTEFLRVLAIVARLSPRFSAELLKLEVVDTLYQILTGVSPPAETSDAASKIDSVVIMQALIHRPKEQVSETLNVICELLPRPKRSLPFCETYGVDEHSSMDNGETVGSKPSSTQQRLELLQDCKTQTRRFAMILLPTLTDAYSSTVNLGVRQRVLTAHLKMLSNFKVAVIEEALRPVPYASFLASILSQQDHPSLVMLALQASELLFERLQAVYQYQFYREGVIGEIKKLADQPISMDLHTSQPKTNLNNQPPSEIQTPRTSANAHARPGQDVALDEKTSLKRQDSRELSRPEQHDDHDSDNSDHDESQNDDDNNDDDNEDGGNDEDILIRDEVHDDDDVDDDDDDGSSTSESSDGGLHPHSMAGIDDLVIIKAKRFMENIETTEATSLRDRALKIRQVLQGIAKQLSECYGPHGNHDGRSIFQALSKYFDGDALESITSSELLDSGIIQVLLEVLLLSASAGDEPRTDFAASFLGTALPAKLKGAAALNTLTPFSVLVQKLQDLLSRAEHYEVLTVNNNASENSRSSSTSLLSRQIRLKLSAEEDGDIPSGYRDIIVSIHAIATFKALDDYLRPRMSMSDRPISQSRRRDMLQQLANARMQQLTGASQSGLLSPFGSDLGLLMGGGTSETRPSSQLSTETKVLSQGNHEAATADKQHKKRSSRRGDKATPNVKSQWPDTQAAGRDQSNLECADEKALEEATTGPSNAEEALAAVVGGLEEEMSDEEMPEPSAVNMEIASTGKVTARQEDGTRVITPMPPGTPVPGVGPPTVSSPGVPPMTAGSIASAGRPFSYAAAAAAVPQDWHLEFSIDGQPILKDTTIYRAVYLNREDQEDQSMRNVWSSIHSIKFKKVKGPPQQSTILSEVQNGRKQHGQDALPASLDKGSVTASILSLLGVLHEINGSIEEVQEAVGPTSKLYYEPLASFINTKLTAKMNRQLEEPLIVASNCLPSWSEDLARLFPFLYPFEARHLFLQSTSFGYSRSMARWQSSQSETDERRDRRRDDRPMMGRLQRQKVRISRNRILESAVKVMEMYGASPSVLEVEYFEEVGTGLGPTLEFYSTVSKEFSKKKLKLWRENESDNTDEYAFGKNGLFPAPLGQSEVGSEAGQRLLHLFQMLGKFVARSMLDSRIIDISFNPAFFKLANAVTTTPTLSLVKAVDRDLANSLAQLQQFAVAKAEIQGNPSYSKTGKKRAMRELTIHGAHLEDLMLDFTLPGYPHIELVKGGSEMAVNLDNVQEYMDRVMDLTLGSGVHKQIEAFKSGFSQVFAYGSLNAFTPDELVMLFGRVEEDWSIETLMDSIKADHGFNMDSKSVKNLLHTMSELTPADRREFLQFVTGSPKLPIGGFKSLTPMFTVVCKPSEPPYSSDDYLPSVMTCVNYLKLPDYSDQEVMRKRLDVAIREGQGAFHLS